MISDVNSSPDGDTVVSKSTAEICQVVNGLECDYYISSRYNTWFGLLWFETQLPVKDESFVTESTSGICVKLQHSKGYRK